MSAVTAAAEMTRAELAVELHAQRERAERAEVSAADWERRAILAEGAEEDRDQWRERAERAEALSPAAARLARAVVALQRCALEDLADHDRIASLRAAQVEYTEARAEVLATWGEP